MSSSTTTKKTPPAAQGGKESPPALGGTVTSGSTALSGQQQTPLTDEGEPMIAGVDPQVALVASTFANLELTSTKQTLAQLSELYEQARQENQRLAAEIKERDRDALQVVEFLRFDIEDKKTQLREVEQKLSTVQESLAEEHQREVDLWKSTVEEKDKTIASCRDEVENLRQELEKVALFRREKQELFLEVAKQKDLLASTTNRYEKELTKLRFQALEDKVQLRAVEKEMTEKFNDEVDARAMLLVDTKAKDIHRENQGLQRDHRALSSEIERITALNHDTQQQNEVIRREAELGRALQREYAKQGCALTMTAKDATGKSKHLETKLTETVEHYERELGGLRSEAMETQRDLEAQLHRSLQSEKILRQELTKMRSLSKRIVGERSELEVFFYEALEHVKNQREASAALQWAKPMSSSSAGRRTRGAVDVPPIALAGSTATAGGGGRGAGGYAYPQSQPQSARVGGSRGGLPSYTRRDEKILRESQRQRHDEHRFFALTSVSHQQPQQFSSRPQTSEETTSRALVPSVTPDSGADLDAPDFGPTPTPGLKAPASQSQPKPPMPHHQGFQFQDLSWMDKETIIRALLHRVNESFYNPTQGGGPSTSTRSEEGRRGGRPAHGSTQQIIEEIQSGAEGYEPVDIADDAMEGVERPQQEGESGGGAGGGRPPTTGATVQAKNLMKATNEDRGPASKPSSATKVPRAPPAAPPSGGLGPRKANSASVAPSSGVGIVGRGFGTPGPAGVGGSASGSVSSRGRGSAPPKRLSSILNPPPTAAADP